MEKSMNISTKLCRTVGLVAGVAAVMFSQHAAANLVDLKWNEQGVFQHTAEIKAGGILEVCGKLPVGMKIDWQYKSQQALDFNIHYHEGKKLSVPVKHQAKQELAEQFEVKVAQSYCWMWSNKTKETAIVDLSLNRLAQ